MARQGMAPVAFGLVVGVAAGQAADRVIATLLVGVREANTVLLVADVLLLAVAAGIAAYLPARRVTRIDPSTTLRCD
jgi:putative ABC transport system permease protein